MADERIIRIKIGGNTSEESISEQQSQEIKDIGKEIIKVINNPVGAVADAVTQGKNYLLSKTIETVGDTIIESLKYSATRKWELTENYIAETNYANAMTVIRKSKSVLSNTMMMGMQFGAVGVAFSLATNAINEASAYRQKTDAINRQLSEQTINTQYSAKRMGLIDNNRGTEN